mmetsp:Transcript_6693/g.24670  ORF Transcript_6693/g.24670 Transcript_6693/m.24670 type:complete len:326 (-) Transcript_6693:1135-2112(-)
MRRSTLSSTVVALRCYLILKYGRKYLRMRAVVYASSVFATFASLPSSASSAFRFFPPLPAPETLGGAATSGFVSVFMSGTSGTAAAAAAAAAASPAATSPFSSFSFFALTLRACSSTIFSSPSDFLCFAKNALHAVADLEGNAAATALKSLPCSRSSSRNRARSIDVHFSAALSSFASFASEVAATASSALSSLSPEPPPLDFFFGAAIGKSSSSSDSFAAAASAAAFAAFAFFFSLAFFSARAAAASAARSCLASTPSAPRLASSSSFALAAAFAACACAATACAACGPFHAPPVIRCASAYALRFFASAFLRPRNPSSVFWRW